MYPQMNYPIQNYPRQEVIRVMGKEGANVYTLGPNSSALLLDTNKPIIYLVQTDGAGYKTITAYSISLYKEEPETTLEERVSRLEAQLNEQSNNSGTKRKTNIKQDDE